MVNEQRVLELNYFRAISRAEKKKLAPVPIAFGTYCIEGKSQNEKAEPETDSEREGNKRMHGSFSYSCPSETGAAGDEVLA